MKAKLLTIQPTHQEEWDTFWEEMVTTGQKKKSLHGSIQVCLLNLQVGMGNFIQKEERFVEESTTFRSKNC